MLIYQNTDQPTIMLSRFNMYRIHPYKGIVRLAELMAIFLTFLGFLYKNGCILPKNGPIVSPKLPLES